MADTNFRGPVNSMGSLEVDSATAAVQPLDGPSMLYQGVAHPDIRSAPFAKDGFRPGQQAAFLAGSDFLLCDNIPQLTASAVLGAAKNGTAAAAVSLVTAQVAGVASAAGIAIGVPIIPLGTSVVTYAAIALDFGFTTGSTVTNSTAVHVVDNSLFRVGQWIVIGGVGNTSASRSHIAQVTTIATANITGINISPAAVTGIINVPIGQANLWGSSMLPGATQFGPAAASANAHAFGGAMSAGLARIYNPREMLARNVVLQCNGSVASYSAIVSGWDVWGQPMTELITMTTQTAVQGKKAFKYISSITCGTATPAGTAIAYGIGDIFGFPMRVDEWENTTVAWNGSSMTNSNGFVAAVTTTATSTTGDVRGSVMLGTALLTGSGIATAIGIVSANGTGRLAITVSLQPFSDIIATPLNTVPKFGVTQSTATT